MLVGADCSAAKPTGPGQAPEPGLGEKIFTNRRGKYYRPLTLVQTNRIFGCKHQGDDGQIPGSTTDDIYSRHAVPFRGLDGR